DAAGWSLTGVDGELTDTTSGTYTFNSVDEAVLSQGILNGTSGADTFDVTGANALTSAGIDFSNVASVNAGIGADQVNTNGATLSSSRGVAVANANALVTQQITFASVENLDLAGGTLAGSDAIDSFEVTGTALTANAISVTNAASVIDAGDGADILTVNDNNSTLTGTDNELDTANYAFSSVETVDLADNALTGTANADTFDVTGANALTSAGINFSNVEVVNADGGADQVNTGGDDASLFAELGNAVDYALETLGITFRETENANLNGGTLAGSSEADSFAVTGTTLTANEISVTNAASAIDAGTGNDAVTVNDANSTLTGTDNALNTANYQFTSIDSADLADNALTGTANADTFDVTGANALTSADIDFTNVASVDANDGDDQVNTNGATLTSETGTAVGNALTTQQIAFTSVENLDLANGTLAGSDAADSFEVNGAALTANAISVTNAASAIDAGTGNDAVTVNDTNSTLTGTDNELDTANYAFLSVETVDLADNALTGTAGVDTFDVTGANALTSAGIDFTKVEVVNAGDGADQVNTDGADASLFAELGSAVDYALETLGITFRETENAELNSGTLTGSSEADSFEVTGTTLTANAITVTNAASAINAGDGVDVLTVNDGNSTLTGTDNELDTANYEFSSVETVDLADNALTGTANADTFDVTGANALTSAGIDFTNVEVVNAGDGADQVNTDGADASMFAELGNAVDYALETLGVTFRETENVDLNGGTLSGSSEADSFDVTGTTLTANGISVTNAASAIDAGNGDDAIIVNDSTSTLTGTANALNSTNYNFTSVEEADLNGGTLAGSSEADSFEVAGAALTANEINITNAASAIDAGTGDDAVTINDANSALTGTDNALNTANYQFTSIESADLTSKALTGT
ncbi:hypothetical protein, partial [uncultured Thalassolituus sp.]|uniref:beta strand repeat-containing protein n=1 Tax=uncultured Thalassolituus sp. TaxID=285273 RepID=UPI0032B13F6C